MKDVDILIMPECRTPAKIHEAFTSEFEDVEYTMALNLLGWPASVVRCGEANHLPIGLQIANKCLKGKK